MSSSDEISDVYLSDIAKQSHIVRQKFGEMAFYRDGIVGMSICRLYKGIMTGAEEEMLRRVKIRECRRKAEGNVPMNTREARHNA